MGEAPNVALRAINIWNRGNVKLLGGILKETPDPPLKAAAGFVNLIRISDTPLLDRILLLTPHEHHIFSSPLKSNIANSLDLSLKMKTYFLPILISLLVRVSSENFWSSLPPCVDNSAPRWSQRRSRRIPNSKQLRWKQWSVERQAGCTGEDHQRNMQTTGESK